MEWRLPDTEFSVYISKLMPKHQRRTCTTSLGVSFVISCVCAFRLLWEIRDAAHRYTCLYNVHITCSLPVPHQYRFLSVLLPHCTPIRTHNTIKWVFEESISVCFGFVRTIFDSARISWKWKWARGLRVLRFFFFLSFFCRWTIYLVWKNTRLDALNSKTLPMSLCHVACHGRHTLIVCVSLTRVHGRRSAAILSMNKGAFSAALKTYSRTCV